MPLRAAAHEGYGRIVFNWQEPVGHAAAIDGDRLTVRFSRTVDTDYTAALRQLDRYIAEIRTEADGVTVSARLKGNYLLRHFDLGAAVVLDLLDKVPVPPAFEAPSRGAPTELINRPVAEVMDEAPQIAVRTGIHQGFTRIVFDWPERVGYRIDRDGETTTIVFDRGARADLSELQQRSLPRLLGARADRRDGRLVVTLRTAPDAGVRHFPTGPKVVVDIAAPGVSGEGKAVAAAPAAAAATARRPAALRPASEPQPAPAPEPKAKPTVPQPVAAASPAPAAPPKPDVPPAEAVSLRIDWNEPVAAAVFRRAGRLWAVFDKPTPIDVAALQAAAGEVVRSVEQVPVSRGIGLRMETAAGFNPVLKREGLAWLLEFRKGELRPQADIEVRPQPSSPVGPRLFVPVPEPGEAIVVNDPEVGDTLAVVPVIPLGHGISAEHQYPQLRILESGQGLVVRPNVDGLRVRSLRQGVEISSGGQMMISGVSPAAEASGKLAPAQPMTRVFDFERWRQGGLDGFAPAKHALLKAVAETPDGPARDELRLGLARFFIAYGMGAEALGVLDVAAAERPELAARPEFRALKGAAAFLLARYDEAVEALDDRALDLNDEALFWRAAAKARNGDMGGAAAELMGRGAVVRTYPPLIKQPLAMLTAEAATEVGDIRQAKRYVELLAAEPLSPARKGELAYLKGRLAELTGAFDDAVFEWDKAIAGVHRPSRARAALARAELLLKLRKIDIPEAAEEIEKLRFAWRGDDFEFNLLHRLAELYMRQNDYGAGLRTLRQLATNFRDHPKAKQVSEEMAGAFSYLYLEGGADTLAPVTAIALYDEFRELTPAGEKGDEMIRKLADRLVFVDLLGRAAELLENQVRFRLDGDQKARVGARLALVRILDRQPQLAIDALDISGHPAIDADLARQRRHLRARALVGLGQMDKALELLKGDETADGSLLRAEILWQVKDWPGAAQALVRVAEESGAAPGKPLSEAQARHVLNLAIALTLGGNERAVVRLRENYDAAMAQTAFKDAFRLIASPQTLGIIDYRTIASRVNDAENFQSFMAAYKEKLRTGRLSQIN